MEKQGQESQTSISSLDKIERVLAEAFGVTVLDGCLCNLENHGRVVAPRVRQALVQLGFDPNVIAQKVKEADFRMCGRMPDFVISDQGFGKGHGNVRLIAIVAEGMLTTGA